MFSWFAKDKKNSCSSAFCSVGVCGKCGRTDEIDKDDDGLCGSCAEEESWKVKRKNEEIERDENENRMAEKISSRVVDKLRS
jgi:hypothetical protein